MGVEPPRVAGQELQQMPFVQGQASVADGFPGDRADREAGGHDGLPLARARTQAGPHALPWNPPR